MHLFAAQLLVHHISAFKASINAGPSSANLNNIVANQYVVLFVLYSVSKALV